MNRLGSALQVLQRASSGVRPRGSSIVGRSCRLGRSHQGACGIDGRFFKRPVHAFDLTVDARVSWFGEPVVGLVLGTGVFESTREELFAAVHGAGGSGAAEQAFTRSVKCGPLLVRTVCMV